MNVQFRKKNKTLMICIHGEIDHHTVHEIRRQIESISSETNIHNIIFDFHNVTFMDSSGIGFMIGRYKELQAFGGKIAVAEANEKIKEIIQLSGLNHIIPMFDTLDEAVRYTERRGQDAV